MKHIGQKIRINNDFLQIFDYPERKDFDFIVKQILYTTNSHWAIQQYLYNETQEQIIDILDNNVKELLINFKISDVIKYIINNLISMYRRFENIDKNLTIIFLKSFFQNIKIDFLKKLVKTIIFKNKYYDELVNTFSSIYDIISPIMVDSKVSSRGSRVSPWADCTVFDPLITEFNNYTIKYISNADILASYKIYQNNNNIIKKLFNYELPCICTIVNNIIDHIKKSTTYIDLNILYIGKEQDKCIILTVLIQTYSLHLYKNIKKYNIHDGQLLKNIIYHLNYIYQLKHLKNIINYPYVVKTNINSIIHNDEILKYFIFGLSKIIMAMISNENSDTINIIYNIISYLKYINNIDTVLQYYYESLKIRVKYYLVNNINHNTILNIENKLIEYLELVNYSKLQIYNDINNYLDSLKTSIDLKIKMNHVSESIFISKKLKVETHNVNIPDIFIKNVDVIKKQYKTDNRKLELSYEDTIVKLSINNITITGTLLPMSMLYYYGSGVSDIFNVMFNNQNEDLMISSLNILKNNNLIINDKINIPTSNIILNENIIDYNKIIEKISHDRNTITKCYIMKTAKRLKSNITKEELYNFTKNSLKYFDLDHELFENMLNNCVEKELLNINSSGLLEY
jgi:hypothetical protein